MHSISTSRQKTGGASRRRSRALGLWLGVVVLFIASLAVLADQWRRSASPIAVTVTGTTLTTADDIRALARVPEVAVLSDLDLHAIRLRIERHPVVREALVRRNPPSTLEIEVRERTPVALLLNAEAKDWLIDDDAVVFPASAAIALHTLPVITGAHTVRGVAPGRTLKDPRLLDALAVIRTMRETDPSLSSLFSEVSIERASDLILYTLVGGVPVIIGRAEDAARKIRSFKAYWENVAIQRDVTELEYVDLRFRDQVVVRWRNSMDAPVPVPVDTAGVVKD